MEPKRKKLMAHPLPKKVVFISTHQPSCVFFKLMKFLLSSNFHAFIILCMMPFLVVQTEECREVTCEFLSQLTCRRGVAVNADLNLSSMPSRIQEPLQTRQELKVLNDFTLGSYSLANVKNSGKIPLKCCQSVVTHVFPVKKS